MSASVAAPPPAAPLRPQEHEAAAAAPYYNPFLPPDVPGMDPSSLQRQHTHSRAASLDTRLNGDYRRASPLYPSNLPTSADYYPSSVQDVGQVGPSSFGYRESTAEQQWSNANMYASNVAHAGFPHSQSSTSPPIPAGGLSQSAAFYPSDMALDQLSSTVPDPSRHYPDPNARAPPVSAGAQRKRARNGTVVPMRADEQQAAAGSSAKQGACKRCKDLKVRCEFGRIPGTNRDYDICHRCLKGNYDCSIPGKKKRKQPPKRGDLMGQIQQQAAEIQHLMKQLELTQRQVAMNGTSPPMGTMSGASFFSSAVDHGRNSQPGSAYASPSAEHDDPLNSFQSARTQASSSPLIDPRLENWLAQARESFQQFEGYIGLGGASVTQDMLLHENLEDGSISDDYDDLAYDSVESDADEGRAPTAAELNNYLGVDALSRRSSTHSAVSDNLSRRAQPLRLATVPTEAAPFGLIADLSYKMKGLAHRRFNDESGPNSPATSGTSAEPREGPRGIADQAYFLSPDRQVSSGQSPPLILTKGVINPDEAEELFNIYFQYMNASVSLLDPVLYSTKNTFYRSPFLFTVICAIASRYYTKRPELYAELMKYARQAAGTALISGCKSVGCVHAYILLALYPMPARRWEDDRTWVFLGMAIRLASDLNLNHPPTAQPQNEAHARELLNRTRAWMNCFNLDRSTGSQYGKAPIIPNSDYIANHSEEWWNTSPHNLRNFDIHLCGYNAELRCMAKFRAQVYSDPNHPTLLNRDVDLGQLAMNTDDELSNMWAVWDQRYREIVDSTDAQGQFRCGLNSLAYSYARLVVLSFGFQHFQNALAPSTTDPHAFFGRCLRAATDVVTGFAMNLGSPTNRVFLRHGPDAQSTFVTFACAFLVKLLHPKYSVYLKPGLRQEIRDNVKSIADLLGSPDVAIDERHGPKMYSSFLRGLLDTPFAQVTIPPNALKRSPRQPALAPMKQRTVSPQTSPNFEYNGYTDGPRSAPASQTTSPTIPMQSGGLSPLPNVGWFGSPNTHDLYGVDDISMAAPATSTYLNPPLGLFDDDLLKSMQPLMDPSWSMPGFGWMSNQPQQYQPEELMQSADYFQPSVI